MSYTTPIQHPQQNFLQPTRYNHPCKPALPFRVERLEDVVAGTGGTGNTVRHQLYGFYWITNGRGNVTVDLQRYNCEKDFLIWFSPGNVITFHQDVPVAGFVVLLSFDYLFMSDPLPKGSAPDIFFSGENCQVRIGPEIKADLTGLIYKMEKELNVHSPNTQILDGLMKLFFLYLSRGTIVRLNPGQNREREIWRKFIVLVKQNFLIKKLVTDYARDLFITPNYLNRVVKRITGSTASYHIQQCIVTEAKRQALYSGASMKEVAYSLGFHDNAHFSKFFKTNSGENFSKYKTTALV